MKWHKVAEIDSLKEGRVRPVVINNKTIALTKYNGKYGALNNACPHQGGPLSEGSIEKGYLRCPWHGWDFCPHSGKSPGSHDDGIDTVFGMVGHSNLGFASALEKQEKNKKINFFGIRHEGAASFACSGYAKTIGKPAACFTIAGPGATNLLTGLWDAKVDRAPVLALTGQVNTQVLGPGAFQEIDLLSAFDAVSTFSQTILKSSNQVELVNLAVKNAILKRNVSHLILPDEVQTLEVNENKKAGTPEGRLPNMAIAPATESLNQAIETIKKSSRPLIIVGYGARTFMADIIKYAETLNAAIITTLKLKDKFLTHTH